MDNQTPNTSPTPTGVPSEGGVGAVIGALIILVVIVIGGLYFLSQRGENNPELNSIESQSSSDEIEAIEADLEATNIDNLDAELNAS